MDPLIIGFIAFLLCAFGARFVAERALRTLPDEQKLALVNVGAGTRAYGFLAAIGLLIAMYLLPKFFPENPRIGLYIGLALAVIFLVLRQVISARALAKLHLDAGYRQQVVIARVIANVGLVILVACALYSLGSM